MFLKNHYLWKSTLNIYISFCIFSYFLSLFLYLNKFSSIVYWQILNLWTWDISVTFYLEFKSFFFLFTVLLISSSILFYSISYMEKEKNFSHFLVILSTFILSMVVLIFSTNFIALMLGWDGLGVSSFLLVIFYKNFNSFNAGYITLFTNRIGDIGLISCMYLMMNYQIWSVNLYSSSSLKLDQFMLFILLLSACTKSAQLPFSAWLPAAMAAPTPVSSLVHSSTLVTAGVYLLLRFAPTFSNMSMMFWIASATTFVASCAALIESDMKKIIALSTLSHLGIMISMISVNFLSLSFSHLIFHAFFKAVLFMSIGLMIHLSNNFQDSRKISDLFFLNKFNSSVISISVMSLCGLPFLTGYYSKDFLLEILVLHNNSMLVVFSVYLICLMSFAYSGRLIYFMMISKSKILPLSWTDYSSPTFLISMIFLTLSSIFMGKNLFFMFLWKMNVLFIESSVKTMIFLMIFLFFSITALACNTLHIQPYLKFFINYCGLALLTRGPFNYWMKICSAYLISADKMIYIFYPGRVILNYSSFSLFKTFYEPKIFRVTMLLFSVMMIILMT